MHVFDRQTNRQTDRQMSIARPCVYVSGLCTITILYTLIICLLWFVPPWLTHRHENKMHNLTFITSFSWFKKQTTKTLHIISTNCKLAHICATVEINVHMYTVCMYYYHAAINARNLMARCISPSNFSHTVSANWHLAQSNCIRKQKKITYLLVQTLDVHPEILDGLLRLAASAEVCTNNHILHHLNNRRWLNLAGTGRSATYAWRSTTWNCRSNT